ncbi:hypothetical protein RJ639_028456 [Escallonia herrerae]|uniref:B box-type domain-containing protein n=1 Tax=Escallonia herrerae TaxID=1293975 RepID=A0AA88X704_9ASTE|nr:hypothetical protein RJ639_028456 [Escallonia herrerae]
MEVDIPHWLPNFLATPYFVANCNVHADLPVNVRRFCCIACEMSTCWHCIASAVHPGHNHEFIQVHVYANHCVVRTEDMIQYLNCDEIQNYTLDNNQVVHLNPRRTPTGVAEPGASRCDTCQFEFVHEHFCCIACKYPLIRSEEDYPPKKRHSRKRPYMEEGFPDARKKAIFIKSSPGSTQQAMPWKKSLTQKSATALVQPSEGVQAVNNVTVVQSSQQNEASKCAAWMELPETVLLPNKKLSSRISHLKDENEDGQSTVEVSFGRASIIEPSEDIQVSNNVNALLPC